MKYENKERTFGKTVAALRKKRGMTQKECAAEIKKDDGSSISPQYLNDIEKDRRGVPTDQLMSELARVLDVPQNSLFLMARELPPDLDLTDWDLEDFSELDAAYSLFKKAISEKGHKASAGGTDGSGTI